MHRDEPKGTTLVDLAALAAGVAAAMALDWTSTRASTGAFGPRPTPDWYVGMSYAIEALGKGCLALGPVILARRARFGGPIRPAEFAALAVGLPRLLLGFQRLPVFGLLVSSGGGRPGYQYSDLDALRSWMLAEGLVAALAAVLAAAGRRRYPRPVVGLLVLVAWYGLTNSGEFFAREALNPILEDSGWPFRAVRLASAALLNVPFGVLGMLPMVAAALDLARPSRRPARPWVDWVAAVLLWSGWALHRSQSVARNRSFWTGPDLWEALTVDATTQAASIGLAAWLVVRFTPARSRWADPSRPA